MIEYAFSARNIILCVSGWQPFWIFEPHSQIKKVSRAGQKLKFYTLILFITKKKTNTTLFILFEI